MVREVYLALGLVSLLTTGEDECRAWTIRRGTPGKVRAFTDFLFEVLDSERRPSSRRTTAVKEHGKR